MPGGPPPQSVIPMLAYENGPAALEWLAKAFGFVEKLRMIDGGRLSHAEMDTGGGQIMLATPSPHYQGPRRHSETCATAAKWSEVPWVVDGVLVYVDDVQGHFERARAAGARILSEPEPGPPAKRYRVEDLEGHRWMFMERS
jgi:uncharacterized glyoxalase superfamily protein PhnB